MAVYYNEIELYAADWLENLIRAGHLPAGDVDRRDLRDVLPSDLTAYTQCHFFAGLGGWAYALRLAGWPEDRPVWTGSCPCQPFSAAGQRRGFADERHLWPSWLWLIQQCRPGIVFGEQVDKAIDWFDVVATDLEAEGYAVGAAVLPAASVGAPHGRHRLWFVADTHTRTDHAFLWEGSRDTTATGGGGKTSRSTRYVAGRIGGESELANTQRDQRRQSGTVTAGSREGSRTQGVDERFDDSSARDVGYPNNTGSQGRNIHAECAGERVAGAPGLAGFWSECDWLPCRDGKSRPVEPSTFPLAHGVPNRVGRLRAYGNAIVPQVAAAFIEAYCEIDA